jgi:hypothetical protein
VLTGGRAAGLPSSITEALAPANSINDEIT